jgi:uncharacterized protein (TIGR03435 family)
MISGLVNHLWQSTLFAGAAWLLTLALRNNRAQVRHWIWFTSSVKFLVPFSLLVGVGSLVPRHPAVTPIPVVWVVAAEQISAPLATPPVAIQAAAAQPSRNYLAAAAFVIWTCGFAAISACWLLRWKRVLLLRRSATPIQLASLTVPILSAPGLVEPGVFGVFRPVLLLPEGIADRLSSAQLEAILAHELCHVRRRDNLTAAIHMIVQATFWFHPLVWWLGMRLTEERERACDEEVLRLGSQPRIYAEGILNVCKLYVESPLACVSGVTGSNLKRRFEGIMKNRMLLRLTLAKKLALSIAGGAAIAAPIAIGVLHAPVIRAQSPPPAQPAPAPRMLAQQTPPAPAPTKAPPAPPAAPDWQTAAGGKMSFEVASIKRGEFVQPSFPLDHGDAFTPTGGRFIANFPLSVYIRFAYKVAPTPDQSQAMFAHLPGWVSRDSFTIEAKAKGNNPTKDQFRLMMQSLLADRFQVAVHIETQQGPMLALTLVKPGKLGPRLRPHAEGPPCDAPAPPAGYADGFPTDCSSYGAGPAPDRMHLRAGQRNTTMADFGRALARQGIATLPTVDQTGLSGRYDFVIEYTPDSTDVPGLNLVAAAGLQLDPLGPTYLDAMRDQLGLKLESTKGPIQTLVIDHVERPSEN